MSRVPLDVVRAAARELLRELVRGHRQLATELNAGRERGARQALAAVEALELVCDAVAGLQPTLDEGSRQVMKAVLGGAWDKLRQAGLEMDGEAGEIVDPSRHRVVRSSAPAGRLPNRVTAVLRPGVVLSGRRVRPSEVTADYVEGLHGTHRD